MRESEFFFFFAFASWLLFHFFFFFFSSTPSPRRATVSLALNEKFRRLELVYRKWDQNANEGIGARSRRLCQAVLSFRLVFSLFFILIYGSLLHTSSVYTYLFSAHNQACNLTFFFLFATRKLHWSARLEYKLFYQSHNIFSVGMHSCWARY